MRTIRTINDIVFHIDKVIEECERNIVKKKNENGDNHGMPAFLRTLEIEKYKGMIEAYNNIINRILRDKEIEIVQNKNEFKDENRLRLFNHIGNGIFKLMIDTKTQLQELDRNYDSDHISKYLYEYLKEHDKTILQPELDCVVMINNQALYRFEEYENSYICDCIESDHMMHFIIWYRDEYKDNEFNGSNLYTEAWGILN